MSRAITFRFGESAGFRIMAEQGLSNEECADIKGDIGSAANGEIKANLESIHVKEMQIDFTPIPEIDKRMEGLPQIRFAKEGVMTFIEIIIPNSSNYGDHDLRHAAVSESILEDADISATQERIPYQEDVVDRENVSLEFSDLMDFSLEPGLRDAIKSLEAGGEDFSLQALEGAFDVFKSLPAHKDLMDFRDLMSEIRKKERDKVKVKAKVKTN